MSAAAKVAFESQTARDFVWPYEKPLAEIPEEPPFETKEKNFYLPRIPPEDCSCYAHACDVRKYKELAEKKEIFLKNIDLIEQQMTAITNDMLDSPCGVTDEAMKTIYETDFAKRGWPFATYKKLMVETDCAFCPPPTFKQVLGLKNGYRDTTNFRLVPHVLPGIDPAKPITFSKTPESINYYWKVWPGRSEYEDTYSRQGRAILLSCQQYLEPLPSSRRRFLDYVQHGVKISAHYTQEQGRKLQILNKKIFQLVQYYDPERADFTLVTLTKELPLNYTCPQRKNTE